MAGLNFTRGVLLDTLAEIAGFRAGLVVTHSEISKRVPDYDEHLQGDPAHFVRIRSEDFSALVQELLYTLGAVASPEPASVMDQYDKYFPDQEKLKVYHAIGEWLWDNTRVRLGAGDRNPVDLSWLVRKARKEFGQIGEEIATDELAFMRRAVNESAWGHAGRHIDWQDQIELEALFKDAGLGTFHGKFFDQRFVDYLSRNFNDLDAIHWRKFEALTAEYFDREGACVELGPGTNDDGVDIRVWWSGNKPAMPAAILVQCKREKAKIPKCTLKALYADIVYEKAESGLIVTSQELAVGTEKTRIARGYPIEQANRATLQQWVTAMRSPHTVVS